jgi:hypothetical protein
LSWFLESSIIQIRDERGVLSAAEISFKDKGKLTRRSKLSDLQDVNVSIKTNIFKGISFIFLLKQGIFQN